MSIHIYDSWVTITHGNIYHNVIVKHLVRSYCTLVNIVIIVTQSSYRISYSAASYRIVVLYIYIYIAVCLLQNPAVRKQVLA